MNKNEKNMAQLDNNVIDVNNFLLSVDSNLINIKEPIIRPVKGIELNNPYSESDNFKSFFIGFHR